MIAFDKRYSDGTLLGKLWACIKAYLNYTCTYITYLNQIKIYFYGKQPMKLMHFLHACFIDRQSCHIDWNLVKQQNDILGKVSRNVFAILNVLETIVMLIDSLEISLFLFMNISLIILNLRIFSLWIYCIGKCSLYNLVYGHLNN